MTDTLNQLAAGNLNAAAVPLAVVGIIAAYIRRAIRTAITIAVTAIAVLLLIHTMT
ncbi:hypothetical protein [Corynebacterium sp. CCM 9203]|uniref:hypothetical protein n=1 Tax=Corynebacterium sp. CCM 9203 TaxID=3057615 RepID=UPI00352666A7